MEDVIARQLLALCVHLFTTDDADVVSGCNLFGRRVRIESVHVADGSARHDDIVERLAELANGEIHRSYSEQRKCVDLDHDGQE